MPAFETAAEKFLITACGRVNDVYDLLVSDLYITHADVDIEHCLLGTTGAEITDMRVYSHRGIVPVRRKPKKLCRYSESKPRLRRNCRKPTKKRGGCAYDAAGMGPGPRRGFND